MHRLVSFFGICLLPLLLISCAPRDAVNPPPDNRVTITPPPERDILVAAPATTVMQAPAYAPIPASVPVGKIAILVPLSGPSKDLGKAMLDAASLALYDKYLNLPPEQMRVKLVLMPKDAGNSPASAARAAEEAIKQGAQLIIGPLYSSAVSAVTPIAQAAGVPVLSFSNNRDVARRNIFVMGFLPEQQVSRVAQYAALRNFTSFGAVLPNDAYGATVGGTLNATLSPLGISVEPIESYARSLPNMEAAAARTMEGYSKTPFTALMLAEAEEHLPALLSTLKARGLPLASLKLVGTGLWDDPGILAMPALQGAWFASSDPQAYRNFAERFSATYGYAPPRLSSLAYDTVNMAADIAMEAGGADFNFNTLIRPEGFYGTANGAFRLLPDGTSERALAVLEIRSGQVIVLEGAPKFFTP